MYELCSYDASGYTESCSTIPDSIVILAGLSFLAIYILGVAFGYVLNTLSSRQKAILQVGIASLKQNAEDSCDEIVNVELDQISKKLRLNK